MALFLSTYVNKIDKKGRISVPATFRPMLSSAHFSGIVAYPSFVHSCIEACDIVRIQQLSDSIDALDPFSEARDAFATSILGGSVQLPFDSEGRVSLPESLIQVADLLDSAVFVGKGATFEIWKPEIFDTYAENARTLAKQERGQLRLQKNPGDSA